MDKPRLFCSRPFQYLEVTTYPERGTGFLCCTSWLPKKPIGNLSKTSFDEMWNSQQAQEIRESILDGSFKFCTSECPFLKTEMGPVQKTEDVTDERMKRVIDEKLTKLPFGPKLVNAAFDMSCNLSCPSCRHHKIIERDSADEILAIQKKFEEDIFPGAELAFITGSGDPFGSPFFLSWLRSGRLAKYPDLKLHLHTNGVLWTEGIFSKIPEEVRDRIISTEISIDAGTPETYAINRRLGNWNKLMKNLEFVAELRRSGKLKHVRIHMVVQANNFREMPLFYELGSKHDFDQIYYSRLANWGTFTNEEYSSRAVHDPSHQDHAEFLEVLKNPYFNDSRVILGSLHPLRNDEYDIERNGGGKSWC